MKMGLWAMGTRYLVLIFVLGSTIAVGCSGRSDLDDDDDDNTGGSGFGGFGGNGSCMNVCERLQTCEGADLDCDGECAMLATDPCATEAYRWLDCLEQFDVCNITDVCTAELAAYDSCLDPGTGNCSPELAPPTASCSSLCARLAPCADPTVDCIASCEESDVVAATTGCTGEYQIFLGCLSTCTDLCALTEDDCAGETNGYLFCQGAYCSANPSAPPCF